MSRLGQRRTHTHCRQCRVELTDANADVKLKTFRDGQELRRSGLCRPCTRLRRKQSMSYRQSHAAFNYTVSGLPRKKANQSAVEEVRTEPDYLFTVFPQYRQWQIELAGQVIRSVP